MVIRAMIAILALGGCTAALGIDGDYQLAETGAGGSSAGGAGGAGGGACPAGMVALPEFCIDATEVTMAAYDAFIASGDVPALTQEHCAGRDTFNPGASLIGPDGPVTSVDICDAHGYCAWAGKELCGRPTGGEAGDPDDASGSAWYRACAGISERDYPYGESHEAGACVDASYGVDAPQEVDATLGCATPEGVTDLVGNVGEWEHSCAQGMSCRVRGGSYASDHSAARCAATVDVKWDDLRPDVGFRCCAPRG